MIDSCDTDVASWSNGGIAFTIQDQTRFETEVLPKYFNHSKFSSFIRQLNFYGFTKCRGEADLQTHTPAVRFAHEFFQKGKPELLNKITRSTAQKPTAEMQEGQIEVMQKTIDRLQREVDSLEESMNEKIHSATLSLKEEFITRMRTQEASYERLLQIITQLVPPMAPSLATERSAMNWVTPNSSPLMGYMDSKMVNRYVRSKNQSF